MWSYRLTAKFLIATIQVNLCCIILASLGISKEFTWSFIVKFLPSTYIITANSWPPPLISQLCLQLQIWTELHCFLQLGCFWIYITSFWTLVCIFEVNRMIWIKLSCLLGGLTLAELSTGWFDFSWTDFWVV